MAVEYTAGFFGAVVPSLGKLLKYEWCLDTTVKAGLRRLQADLRSMQPFLESVARLPPDLQLDPQVKLQADEVMELSCAIDTRLHSFLVRIELGIKSTKHTLLPAMITEWGLNHEIDSFIKEAQHKVKESRDRYGVYPSKSIVEGTSTQKVDPRILAMYIDEPDPVGITEAIAEVTEKLSKRYHVSIVGMGGKGKTILARAVYANMIAGFDYGAFVYIGQRAGPEKILKDILDALRNRIGDYDKELKQLQLANQLQDFLVDKRCLFVIDDIWNEETWLLVERVCKGHAGNKIITTSRSSKISNGVGGDDIYNIKELSPEYSKELFRKKIFCGEAKGHEAHDSSFDSLSDKILPQCGGVPMAITLMGSLFARKQSSEWPAVYDSIGFDEHKMEGAIEKVMHYSYVDLPTHLRRCFLYLNLFPEGQWIEKHMLIWKWVAEGLVPDGLFETGETYLNDLIDRSMIQWAVSPRDVGQGGCRVHSFMHHLIRVRSSNENFSTVPGSNQETISRTGPIHRLAIHETVVGQNQNTSLEVGEVLSFCASTCTGSSLPPLSEFKRLRVVDLEGCDLSVGDCKLEDLGELAELEYVGLVGTHVSELPEKIGRLKLIQTLDVTATGISKLPPFVEELETLRCLRAGKGTRMMGRVGKLTLLEELWLHSADKSPDFAVELRKLTRLRVLVIHFDEMEEGRQKQLVESLCHLKNLQVLQIWFDTEGKVRLDGWEGSVPNPELRQLLLFGVILSKQTPWIHHLSVPKLSKLLLQVETLEAQHLEILGQMPSLLSLYLHSEDGNRLSYTAGREEFKVLQYLNTNIELICGKDALPRIQELEVGGVRVGTDVGLRGNMPLLERVTYHLDCRLCGRVEVEKAEEELRQLASRAHRNNPPLSISIKRWNNIGSEIHHHLLEFLTPEIMRAGHSLTCCHCLGGGDDPMPEATTQAQTAAYANALLEATTRALTAVGAPPTLTVGDGAVSTSSPSLQEPTRISEGNTKSSIDSLSDCFGDHAFGDLAALAGADLSVWENMFQKCMENPRISATIDSMVENADDGLFPLVSDFSGILQLMMPDIVSHFKKAENGPGQDGERFAISRMTWPMVSGVLQVRRQFAASTQEPIREISFERDAKRLSAMFDRMTTDDEMPIKFAPGIMEKCMQNPEFVACMNSKTQNNGNFGFGPDLSTFARLLAPELLSGMIENPNWTGHIHGAGADANLAGNDGAGPSRKPSPKLDGDKILRWFNSPEGAAYLSKGAARFGMGPVAFEQACKKLLPNPEMIASMNSAMENADMSTIDIVKHVAQQMMPDITDFVLEKMKIPFSMPMYASGGVPADASSTRVALPQTGQDGESFSRMLKQVLPAVLQALDAGEQPSSMPENVGPEEGGGA